MISDAWINSMDGTPSFCATYKKYSNFFVMHNVIPVPFNDELYNKIQKLIIEETLKHRDKDEDSQS